MKREPIHQMQLSNQLTIQEGRLISRTTYQSVYEGLVCPRGDSVTIKKIQLSVRIDREVSLLRKLAEAIGSWGIDNLMQYIDVKFNMKTYELIMTSKYISHDLADMLRLTYNESEIRDYVRTLMSLLKNLFERGIKFIDLKPSNFLADTSGKLFVCDYIAPDIIAGLKNPSEKNCMYESGRMFKESLNKNLQGLKDIIKEFYKAHDTTKLKSVISMACWEFINAIGECVNKELFTADFEHLLNHPYLSSTDLHNDRKDKKQVESDQVQWKNITKCMVWKSVFTPVQRDYRRALKERASANPLHRSQHSETRA